MRHLLLAVCLFSSFSLSAQDRCSPQFQSVQEKIEHLEGKLTSHPQDQNTLIYQKYKSFKTSHPELAEVLPENTVYDLLVDVEMLATAKNMENVLDGLAARIITHPGESHAQLLRGALKKNLEGKVPAGTIEARLDDYFDGGTIYRALGEKTHQEVALMYHGGNPLDPTADSLLGQFIAKHQASTVKRAFSHGPGYTTFGQEKLVVSVDMTMLDDFKALMNDQHLLTHLHTTRQGTLIVGHGGLGYHYGASVVELSQVMNPGTIIPTVLLSSTEAQRTAQYMKGMLSPATYALVQKPWLTNSYCAKGGYTSCTHWVGNMPIGDEMVGAYTFPGRVDRYADNQINPDPELDKLPRTQELAPYEFPENFVLTEDNKALVRRIWKVPGNQQFAYLMGIGRANEYGQLANPGWVAHVFTSRIKVDRSPVVFIIVPDAKQPLPVDFDPQINAI